MVRMYAKLRIFLQLRQMKEIFFHFSKKTFGRYKIKPYLCSRIRNRHRTCSLLVERSEDCAMV